MAARGRRGPARARSAVDCGWAVRATSRYIPGASCLTRALAAQMLLTESGYDSRIEVGVAKDEHRRFHAHAWVVCEGNIVIGAEEAYRYVPLAGWDVTVERTN